MILAFLDHVPPSMSRTAAETENGVMCHILAVFSDQMNEVDVIDLIYGIILDISYHMML